MTGRDRKIVGIIFFIIFLCSAYYSLEIYQGEIPYPQECHTGKGSIICDLQNIVFEEGGYYGVAMLNLAFSLIFLVLGYLMFIDESYSQSKKVIGRSVPKEDTQDINVIDKDKKPQTFEDILHGEEPTEEFLEDFVARRDAPELSDYELERQALAFKPDTEEKQ